LLFVIGFVITNVDSMINTICQMICNEVVINRQEDRWKMGYGMAIDWLIAVGCTLVVGDPQSTLCFVVPVTVSRSLPWIQNDWLVMVSRSLPWIKNDWLGLHLPRLGNPVVKDRPCGVKGNRLMENKGKQRETKGNKRK
jgi:hypothetical protein